MSFLCLSICLMLGGCSGSPKLVHSSVKDAASHVKTGMTRDAVIAALGKPSTARPSAYDSQGELMIYEYSDGGLNIALRAGKVFKVAPLPVRPF